MSLSSDVAEPIGPSIIFDLDALLIDTIAGVRNAFNAVARMRRGTFLKSLTRDDLRNRSLTDYITDIAGCSDPAVIAELTDHYWRVHEQEVRFRAPLLPGAARLLETLKDQRAELHYVSTDGPEAATRLVQRRGMQQMLTTIYTPPVAICPRARAPLLEDFINSREQPADSHLLLSDNLFELHTALRLGVPALALGYGQTPRQVLDAAPGLLGVAHSPDDVGSWLLARETAQRCLLNASRRPSARLH